VSVAASSSSEVTEAEAAGTGYWTAWLDVDPVADRGTGEFEDCRRVHYEQNQGRQCLLGCDAPKAARYSVVDAQNPATWNDIGTSTEL